MSHQEFYTIHERIWHWLQALTIIALMITGAEIHAPQSIRLLGFNGAVQVHNAFAILLLINAALGFFYFFTTGLMKIFGPPFRRIHQSRPGPGPLLHVRDLPW